MTHSNFNCHFEHFFRVYEAHLKAKSETADRLSTLFEHDRSDDTDWFLETRWFTNIYGNTYLN